MGRHPGDEGGGDERPGDGAERIARAVETERLAAVLLVDRIGKYRVAERLPQPLADPRQRLGNQNERPRDGQRAERERRAGERVAADDKGLALADAVREPADDELDGVREEVGGALDQAHHASDDVLRHPEHEEERGEDGARHLVADVGEEAREPRAQYGAVEPGGRAIIHSLPPATARGPARASRCR